MKNLPPPSFSSSTNFDAVVFAGGGCRCFWQAGFWQVAAPALSLEPRTIGAVSAGAAMACGAVANVLPGVLESFKRLCGHNPRNIYPQNWRREAPIFPHEAIYRKTIVENLDASAVRRIHAGPEVRILLSRPPRWLGSHSGVLVGALAYHLDKLTRSPEAHPAWSRRFGFSGDVVSARMCRDTRELADLILHSSCTPPLLPQYRRNREIVLDGGLIEGVPVGLVNDAQSTLVLMSRHHEPNELPRVPGRTYVAPSRPIPIAKWDYASPDLVQQTFDLGRRDAERFVARRLRSSESSRARCESAQSANPYSEAG